MSLTVQHINNDSTFLLRFDSSAAPPLSTTNPPTKGFTVLIDPWLGGPSSLFHPAFQLTTRPTDAILTSLAQLADVDLILVTQDKPDHCHKETLCSLPKDTSTVILATPAAAKKIRKWNHFDSPSQIVAIPGYDPRRPDTVFKVPIQVPGSTDLPGEVAIAHICSRVDIAGLHNAIGITYRPPQARLQGNGCLLSRTAHQGDVAFQPISVIYTPHGVTPATLDPYIRSFPDANPATVLFHSFTIEENPRLLGGVVNNGAISGTQVAKFVKAKHWIGAHDEPKENSGFAVKWLKTRPFELDEVKTLLRDAGLTTDVCVLGCGEIKTVRPSGLLPKTMI